MIFILSCQLKLSAAVKITRYKVDKNYYLDTTRERIIPSRTKESQHNITWCWGYTGGIFV